MTSPAAAARRQYALDRIVEDLVEWGCPLAYADERARRLLDRALDAGYRLPDSIADAAPPPGVHSTAAGRVRARLQFVHRPLAPHADGYTDCACRHWSGPAEDHPAHLAAMLVVAGVATVAERLNARPDRGVEATNTRPPVPEGRQRPTEPHRGAERDA
jgi:hypothetical protein